MKKSTTGFTIVELLIVIVVIAILAAISIVAYTGIQNRAHDSSVQNDLKNLMTKVEYIRTLSTDDKYPIAINITDFKANKSAYATASIIAYNLVACWDADRTFYGFVARSKADKIFYITSNSRSVKQHSGAWETTSGAMCTAVLAEATNSYNGYARDDTTTGPWRAWAGGN